ncbi:MAG TPA: Pycsar system effector family protein [Caulobacteraceae bacterium]|jgi:hypothetical protein
MSLKLTGAGGDGLQAIQASAHMILAAVEHGDAAAGPHGAGSPDGEGSSAGHAEASPDHFSRVEAAFLHERFADFERAVLQDNIILGDAKLGILVAFAGAMVIYCIDMAGRSGALRGAASWVSAAEAWGFAAAAVGFLVTCAFALAAIAPRVRPHQADADYVFWGARAFRQPLSAFLDEMRSLDVEVEHENKLRHLYILAGVCRDKYAHLRLAMGAAAAAFGLLVLVELAHAVLG